MPSGFLLIDKPVDFTSHDVVAVLRRITGIRRIGHAGTLDPFATGLLIVGVGREATKHLDSFLKSDKGYAATMMLGASSDTQDLTGEITPTERTNQEWPTEQALRECLTKFTGPLSQTPPMYSAKKIAGRKLYELAREGQVVERKPVNITIHALQLTRYAPPEVDFTVHCSSGTYVRTIAHDVGACLGTGAYLTALRRISIGKHDIASATPLAQITKENWTTLLKNLV